MMSTKLDQTVESVQTLSMKTNSDLPLVELKF